MDIVTISNPSSSPSCVTKDYIFFSATTQTYGTGVYYASYTSFAKVPEEYPIQYIICGVDVVYLVEGVLIDRSSASRICHLTTLYCPFLVPELIRLCI